MPPSGFFFAGLAILTATCGSTASPESVQFTGEGLLTLEWPRVPADDNYENLSYPEGSGAGGIVQWSLNTTVPSTGRNYTIHVGSLSSGLPNAFRFDLPEGGKERLKLMST